MSRWTLEMGRSGFREDGVSMERRFFPTLQFSIRGSKLGRQRRRAGRCGEAQ